VASINAQSRVPFIRIMPRNQNEDTPDPAYYMQAFLDGEFDLQISQWAIAAKATGIPLLVEFGTEVNGNWFSWNGQYAGADTVDGYGDATVYDGAERFRDVYRHIIDLFNAQNVDNITWFFHINVENFFDYNQWSISISAIQSKTSPIPRVRIAGVYFFEKQMLYPRGFKKLLSSQ
jgi:hypothetical protein